MPPLWGVSAACRPYITRVSRPSPYCIVCTIARMLYLSTLTHTFPIGGRRQDTRGASVPLYLNLQARAQDTTHTTPYNNTGPPRGGRVVGWVPACK